MRDFIQKHSTKVFLVSLVVLAVLTMGAWREQADITELQTNQITPIRPGTTLVIGESGDTITWTGTLSGDLPVSGSVTVGNELVQKTYTVSGVTEYTLESEDGNIILLDKVAVNEVAIALPTITAALDGYVLTFKQIDSGTSNAVLTPTALTDTIESTRGTATGTSDATINAAGDTKSFVADFESGVSGVWRQLFSNQS